MKKAGLSSTSITKEGGRRILAVDPKLANRVPLFIFDRKS
jgi:hypothetical protein